MDKLSDATEALENMSKLVKWSISFIPAYKVTLFNIISQELQRKVNHEL